MFKDLRVGIDYHTVNVYRWDLDDCTAGGVTSQRGARFVLLTPGTTAPDDVPGGIVLLRLVRRQQFGDMIAVPVTSGLDRGHGMFGGNFVWSSDSRFPSRTPIKVHDRFEAQRTGLIGDYAGVR